MTDVLSDLATNAVATPVVRDSADQHGGYLRTSAALLTVSASQADTDNVIGVPVPVNARVQSVKISAADASTAGAVNVGVFTNDGDGTFTVKDADLFASAFDLASGPYYNQEVINESAEYTATEQTQPLWEVLGYASEAAARAVATDGYFWISLDISTTFNGGPTTIGLKAEYVL
jgi:hypothetical protein